MTVRLFRSSRLALAAFLILIAGATAPASAEVGFLGVSIQAVEDAIAEALELAPGQGVLVSSVLVESPAEKAELRVGDVIVEVDGKKIGSPNEFRTRIRTFEPGESVDLRVLRSRDYLNLAAVLGEAPRVRKAEKEAMRMHDRAKRMSVARPWVGVSLQDLEESSLASYFDVEENSGSLVTEVLDESPAQKAGIESGDVIVGFGDKAVREGADLIEAVREHEVGDEVELRIVRRGKEQTVKLTLESRPLDVSMQMPGMPPKMRSHMPRPPMAPHIQRHDGRNQGALEELREELEQLRRELEEMRDDS